MRMPNGYGTVTKLSGDRRRPYAVRVPVHDRKGRPHKKYLSYHKSHQEAVNALLAYNQQHVAGVAPAPDKLSVTLQEVYNLWSARKYAKAGAASIMSYKASWNRVSVLARKPIRDLGIDQMQSIIDEDERNKLSKSSIYNDALLIKTLCKFAMERDFIIKDYSAFLQLPHVDAKHEKGAFTDLQIKQLEQLVSENFPWADTVLMLCYTGFRISEFLSLTRFDYNEQEQYLRGGVKTAAGKNRIVPIHPKIKPLLLCWLEKSGDTIVCNNDGTRITPERYRKYAFQPVMQKLGIANATPHWCRHTFATRLHAAGVEELECKRLLGHANTNVTEVYTHTLTDSLRTAILKLA